MSRKMQVVSPRIAAAATAVALAVAVLGCSGSTGEPEAAITVSGAGTEASPAGSQGDAASAPDNASDSGADSGPGGDEDAGPETTAEAESAATPDTAVEDNSLAADPTGPIRSTPREDVPSALQDPFGSDHPEPLVDLDEIRGVVPPDAIPALEDPAFEPAAEVGWLAPVEPVLALEINGDARAYPLRIMTWHELVNGTVGGVPVTVSYCPLCNSAVAYDRRVGERILDFGTSGALFNSSLVMYDRQTESLWSHYTGEAIIGHLTGIQLDLIPVQTVSFERFLASHPGGQVLSLDTGHFRRYGQNPYEFYDSSNRPFLFSGPFDDRLEPITRVLALRDGGEGAVVPYDVLAEHRVVPFAFAGRELVALFEPGTASALDSPLIEEGRDVGATGVFVGSLDGHPLELSASPDGGFVDAGTGAVFDILGRPTGGSGPALEPVEHLDTFWFAAAAFYPDAEIIGR
ncbi:MAG: DUF3179 domain-containing (seleno)protein [Acidimicrobiaceae bacterium]|nr:DUF3179 domain-containing (seleno)protein [Acidimicrobiaceae bacterium]MCY3643934.1 DUF3179 domain-containing (seleno)protein [Acidimicrobiaceae bacterium]